MKKKFRKCKECGHKFEVFPTNPQKEYCSGECWCLGNGVNEENIRHFLDGHKNTKKRKLK